MGVGVARQSSKSTPFLSFSVPMSLLSPSLCLQLSWATSLLIHVLWHMINPSSHISSHVSAASLLYRLRLKWSDNFALKYHQIKTVGMCKQHKYTPKPFIKWRARLTPLLKLCWPCNIERFCVVEPDSTLVISWLLSAGYSLLMIFVMLCVLVLEQLYS